MTALDLYSETNEKSIFVELEQLCQKLSQQIEEQEIFYCLSSEYDKNNAIIQINSGSGGTEAMDWVSMLLRLYSRWVEKQYFKITILESTPGEEAGFKSITAEVKGKYAYGKLKQEIGVHRLVRISPFDSNKRRHTSFASVFVSPEVADNIVLEIKETDLRIDTYRATGAGGQHVNTTDSAVRITHLPTGIKAQCQNERSQHKNKATALKILKSSLIQREIDLKNKEKEKQEGNKKSISWGSQIRSYILQPYQLVKDHRSGLESSNVQGVLDGDIDSFIRANLLKVK